MTPEPFFDTLGALASHQQENQLSRTFKACFDHSAQFQSLILDFISGRLGTASPQASQWVCEVERAVKRTVGRLDLHLRSHDRQLRNFGSSRARWKVTAAHLTSVE